MDHPIARHRVNGAGSVGICRADHGSRGLSGWTKRIPYPAPPRRRRIAEVLFPKKLSGIGVDSVKVVGDARFHGDLFHALRGLDVLRNQYREEGVHLFGFVIQLQLPEKPHTLHIIFVEDRLIGLPIGAPAVKAVREPIRTP